MGYVSIAFIALTAIALVFGTLFGMARGRNRAIMRLIQIIICAVLAIALRGLVVDTLLTINLGEEGSLKDIMLAAINESGTEIPASIMNLVFALIEIFAGLGAYFVLFFGLRIVTRIIIYPICKIWVKKGPRYTVDRKKPTRKGVTTKTKINKRKWWGALVGLIQGIFVAFFVLAPLTGILVQVDKVSKVKLNGEYLFELPEEVGISEYTNSTLGKIYYSVGGWYFDIVTSTKTEDGTKVSIDDTIDIVVTVTDIADTVTGLTDSIEKMSNLDFNSSDPENISEAVDAMTDLGDALVSIGTQINDLSDDAKDLINGLLEDVKDLIPDDDPDMIEIKEAFDGLTINDLDLAGIGNALKGVATILDKTEGDKKGEAIDQPEITQIVEGLASNEFILNLIPDEEPLLDVNELEGEDIDLANMFRTAIEGLDEGASKDKLEFLFGLN